MESEILSGLNPAQREAVVHYDTHSLIIAGAGSGKTRVLTSRIAYMIQQGVEPRRILALTFTNKAAAQMRERIEAMLPGADSRPIRMGTFHSVFARILRENAERIGYPPTYTIYDTSDARNLLKTLIREMNLDEERYKPARIAARISMAKNGLVTPGAYQATASLVAEDRQGRIPETGDLYARYMERCKRNGAMDFDDLLLQTNILLRDCPDVLARYQEQFRYILVDEYQDTNFAQYVIIRRLSERGARVCVVGDDAQSIYSFRGAKIENILSFRKDYPDALTFKLERNYRSTRTIVEAANSVIARNSKRMEKTCFSEGAEGDRIRVLRAYTDREEAEMVVTDLRDRVRGAGDGWAEAAILYRTNNQSAVLEEHLRRRGIPYRIYKGSSFYDHKEIKDLMAYIRLVVNPRDDEAFRRIVNYPARGIGDVTVQRIAAIAEERQVSMWEAVDALAARTPADAVERAIARKVAEFVELIRSLSLARAGKGLYELGMEIASRSGMLAAYRSEHTPEAASALDNIEELLNSMQLFREQRDAEIRSGERPAEEEATIEEWLQQVMLLTDMDKDEADDRDKVTLMTVHSAKGLEFKYVYIVGLEENLFPSQRAMESPEGFEEERRLFYVALTRAKVAATLSHAEMRFKWGNMEFSRPSCFLREIDGRYLEQPCDDTSRPVRGEGGPSAIEELRRRFDYRFRQGGAEGAQGGQGAPQGRYGERGGSGRSGGDRYRSGDRFAGGRQDAGRRFGPSDGESGAARRYPAGRDPYARGQEAPAPRIEMPRPSTAGMRSLGVRPAAGAAEAAPGAGATAPTAAPGDYREGQRVAHARFGEGVIVRIETLSADRKLVVKFDAAGEKTLLAKFAKLTLLT